MQTVTIGAIGDPAVGKTLLLLSYTGNYVPTTYQPTALDCYWTNTVVDDTPVDLTVWDNSGSSEYTDQRPLSYPQTDVFLVCFSLKSRQSFTNVQRMWMPELKKHSLFTPCILVGCMNDNYPGLSEKAPILVTSSEGRSMSKLIGAVQYVETSAITRGGLHEAFSAAVRVALQYRKERSRYIEDS